MVHARVYWLLTVTAHVDVQRVGINACPGEELEPVQVCFQVADEFLTLVFVYCKRSDVLIDLFDLGGDRSPGGVELDLVSTELVELGVEGSEFRFDIAAPVLLLYFPELRLLLSSCLNLPGDELLD
ncbi:hypothetical protein [Schaalia turicensis]